MNNEDKEIIRDLLMYLSGAIDSSSHTSFHHAFCYVRGNLKKVYDNYLVTEALVPPRFETAPETNNLQENHHELYELFYDEMGNTRIYNSLKAENIHTIEDLKKKTMHDLSKVPNLGRQSLKIIYKVMREKFNHTMELNNGGYVMYWLRKLYDEK